jgi:hypothetical protein
MSGVIDRPTVRDSAFGGETFDLGGRMWIVVLNQT